MEWRWFVCCVLLLVRVIVFACLGWVKRLRVLVFRLLWYIHIDSFEFVFVETFCTFVDFG